MAKYKDITGQRFGMLTATEFVEYRGSRSRWLFLCDCGNETEQSRANINENSNCGCNGIVGQKFNKLTAIIYLGANHQGRRNAFCLFRCECGNEKEIRRSSVIHGDVKACGCLERKAHDITGQKFGMLTAIRIVEQRQFESTWLFHCDCGTEVLRRKNSMLNSVKNASNRPHCGCASKGENSVSWRGGVSRNKNGYVLLYLPDHPSAQRHGFILEHRFVMEQKLGRQLLPNENVHHLNGIRNDNRIENLELWGTAQPCGQRIEDKIKFALEILKLYAPEKLKPE